MQRRIRPATLAIAITLPVLLASACAWLTWPALHARYLVHELQTLHIGHSTFDDAQRLAETIGAERSPFAPCTRAGCQWSKRIDNERLPRWWRGAGTGFAVDFEVKSGLVAGKSTGFGIGALGRAYYPSAVSVTETANSGRSIQPTPVQTTWYSTNLSPYSRLRISMTLEASAADRRRYAAFNYGCLWKYKGCRDYRDLLPSADSLPASSSAAPGR